MSKEFKTFDDGMKCELLATVQVWRSVEDPEQLRSSYEGMNDDLSGTDEEKNNQFRESCELQMNVGRALFELAKEVGQRAMLGLMLAKITDEKTPSDKVTAPSKHDIEEALEYLERAEK